MRIAKIEVKNFRCFGADGVSVELSDGLVSIVGENNAGKSTLISVANRLIENPHRNAIEIEDRRSNDPRDRPDISVVIELTDREITTMLEAWFQSELMTGPNLLDEIVPLFKTALGNMIWYRKWGPSIREYRSVVGIGELEINASDLIRPGGDESIMTWDRFLTAIKDPDSEEGIQLQTTGRVRSGTNLESWLLEYISDHFIVTSDVRNRPSGQEGDREKVKRSLDGTQTADLLAELKMGDDQERAQFDRIKKAFSEFFPDLEVEVTGGREQTAKVVFTHEPHTGDLDQQYLGTGVLEVLTLITNLVGLDNSVLVIEEPELHLHRLSQVALMRLFMESAKRNQIILLTHSSSFIDFSDQPSIVIVRPSVEGSSCTVVTEGHTPGAREAFADALTRYNAADILFARVVLLVEGSTEVEFFKALGPRIGRDLETNGVAVVSVEGHTRFNSYIHICQSLGVPIRCLQDKDRGASRGEFGDLFKVLNDEIEAYWKRHGMTELLVQAKKKIGSLSDNKIRFGRWVGKNVELDSVPILFVELLDELIQLSAGVPSTEVDAD